jgi:hypothetical protein
VARSAAERGPRRRLNERGRLTLIEPYAAGGCRSCVTSLHSVNRSPRRRQLGGVSGRVPLVRSDADRVCGTGAGRRGASD